MGGLVSSAASLADPDDVEALIADLERQAEDPMGLLVAELRRYEKVPQAIWAQHMPVGFRERIAKNYISRVFRGGRKCTEYMKELGRALGIEESVYFKDMMRLATMLDELLLVDRVHGFINFVSTERICRRLAGLEA